MIEYKFFGNWRQVISINDVDYCKEMKNPESTLAKLIASEAGNLQNIAHPCPYLPGPLRISNFTNGHFAMLDKLDDSGKYKDDGGQWYFKGDMRLTLKLSTANDPKALNLMLAYTLSFRNADSF